jgi:hypothetical protein
MLTIRLVVADLANRSKRNTDAGTPTPAVDRLASAVDRPVNSMLTYRPVSRPKIRPEASFRAAAAFADVGD